jgi:excisionase family DNA binding protein
MATRHRSREDPERLLTAAEAAQILYVSVPTVRRWAREGALPSVIIPGGRRRFRISDLPGFCDHGR